MGMMIAEIFAKDLRGHEYIKAHGLSPKSVREQQPHCERCALLEMEPVVRRIVENWNPQAALALGDSS